MANGSFEGHFKAKKKKNQSTFSPHSHTRMYGYPPLKQKTYRQLHTIDLRQDKLQRSFTNKLQRRSF